MPDATENLPEGTDSVLDTNAPSAADIAVEPALSKTRARVQQVIGTVEEKTAGVRAQATEKARAYAAEGKDRAVTGLDSVQKLIDDAAATIDEKVGPQYGDYARKAAGAVSGFAETLRGKEIDDLVADAREAVKKSPAIAIGAAAALGFVVARLIKAGSAPAAPSTEAEEAPRTSKAPRRKPAKPADDSAA